MNSCDPNDWELTDLLSETRAALRAAGHSPKDVLWVGAEGFAYETWDEFAAAAGPGYSYWAGYGLQEVAADLVVAGDGWWLERREYDGSEQWVLERAPRRPEAHRAGLAVTSRKAAGRPGAVSPALRDLNAPKAKKGRKKP
jgi:hypothetical protein